MQPKKFIIVGSGWRAMYYARIAKALPQHFALGAMLCRSQEKADRIAREENIPTSISKEECLAMEPDFVVVAVNKASMAQVSLQWMETGLPVLCETPAAMEVSDLHRLWDRVNRGGKLVVAEQYIHYPTYRAMLQLLARKSIGEIHAMNISLAHEYHGASLLRALLGVSAAEPFQVSGKTYTFPTAETRSRYEIITDGRLVPKKRTVATFEFMGGKTAWYDFDSEQYRSFIRSNYVKILGSRGELKDDTVTYLDENNHPQTARMAVASRILTTDHPNPNLHTVEEITQISLTGDAQPLYTPYFGLCGLSEDETAMAVTMWQAAHYREAPAKAALQNALQDAYMAILMQRARDTGERICSTLQPWHE